MNISKKIKKPHRLEGENTDTGSIKLVLPLKNINAIRDSSVKSESESASSKLHKHKKKKKKKHKHKHDREERKKRKMQAASEMSFESKLRISLYRHPIPVSATAHHTHQVCDVEDESTRSSCGQEIGGGGGEEVESVLQRSLEYLHNDLQSRDVNGFFAFPVTDAIAPMYSQIISTPMDFSSMKSKIASYDYLNIREYKQDYVLMCENAMKYNHPDTIYHKEANKLLKIGLKLLSKDRIYSLKRKLGFMSTLTDEEIGYFSEEIPINSSMTMDDFQDTKPKFKRRKLGKFEAFPDNLMPEMILAQAKAAAKEAKEELTLRKPNTKFGFLRRREDGSTTLNFLNPDITGNVGETERIVNLGELTGKLTTGTGSIAGFREDKRNGATPVNYLNYGPFSSYAPIYDSSFATVSKEESDLLMSTYGDELGIQYAKSLLHFVEDSGAEAICMADSLLDILTNGDHSKNKVQLEQQEQQQQQQQQQQQHQQKLLPPVNNDQLPAKDIKADQQTSNLNEPLDNEMKKSVCDNISNPLVEANVGDLESRESNKLDIDKQTEDGAKEDSVTLSPDSIQLRLDSTSALINDLANTQHHRLSQPLPSHMAYVNEPTDHEMEIAGRVTKSLTELTKQLAPKDVLSSSVIRTVLGITAPQPADQTDCEVQTHPAGLNSDVSPERHSDFHTDSLQSQVEPNDCVQFES